MSKTKDLDRHYAESYDAEANRYDNLRFGSSRGSFAARYKNELALDLLDRYGAFHEESRILDCPSGTGRITHAIVGGEWPFGHIHAVDISEKMIEVNREKLPGKHEKVTFMVANMKKLDLESNYFDGAVIASFAYLVPMEEYAEYLADIHRVLKPGGVAVIEVSNVLCAYNPLALFRVLQHRYIQKRSVKSYVAPWELRRIFQPFDVLEYRGAEFFMLINNYRFYRQQSKLLGSLPVMKWFSGKFTVVLRKKAG